MNFAKKSMYSLYSGLFTVIGSFVSGVIVANSLGVHGAGMVAFLVWLAFVIVPVVDGGTALSVGRFMADLKGKDDAAAARALPGLLARRLLMHNLIGALALAAFLAARAYVPSFAAIGLDIPFILIVWVAVLVFVQSLGTFSTAYLRGGQNFKLLSLVTSASMIVQIAALYYGIKLNNIAGAVAAYAIGQACLASVIVGLFWRRNTISPDQRREIDRFGRFSWAANVCNTFVWSRIEIIILQSFWGFHEVGLFSVALALSSLASQGPLLLTGAFLPMFAEKHGRNDRAGLQSAFLAGTRLLALIAFPTCFGMAAIAPVLIRLIYGPAFEPAAFASTITVIAAAFSISTVIGTHLVNALGRSDFIFASSSSGAVLSIVFGLSLIPGFGLAGAAISRSAVQLIMIGMGLWFIRTRLGFRYDFAFVLRTLASAIAAALAAAAVVGLLPTATGLVAAILLAVPVYLLCLRLSAATHADDVRLAMYLIAPLPRPVGEAAGLVLAFVHPRSGLAERCTTKR